MRAFLLKFFVFLGCVFLVDISIGKTFDYLRSNAKGGATYRDNYICNEMSCDLLLMGSSRCEHHYNPIVFEDSLNLSCFNAGQAGNGIIVAYARYLMICQRSRPQLVIYDIIPEFDLLKEYDNHRYLTWLKSYYERDFVKEIFDSVDNTEKYKMISSLYRYNSRFIEIIIDCFHPIPVSSYKGYEPLRGDMDKDKVDKDEIDKHLDRYDFDPLKIHYIEKLIDQVGEENIIMTISPRWYGMDKESFKPLIDICQERGVRFMDFANDPKYVHNDLFFKDGNHLNERGADEFSRDMIQYLKF